MFFAILISVLAESTWPSVAVSLTALVLLSLDAPTPAAGRVLVGALSSALAAIVSHPFSAITDLLTLLSATLLFVALLLQHNVDRGAPPESAMEPRNASTE